MAPATAGRARSRGQGRSQGSSGKPLVIVESPAKARTIAGLLGDGFVVESSVGHVRDLPRRAEEIPAAYKSEAWARLGVDVDNGFKPLYVIAPEKKAVVAKLRELLADASEVYLATDEDREGESIAWHLMEVLSPTVPVKRMVFHEITRPAIERAVHEWRDLDRRLVDAQEARRILDRLYGYEVSPVLWRKVMPRLSAGRVQSVATRMIVQRERERMAFRSATWWDIEGVFSPEDPGELARARRDLSLSSAPSISPVDKGGSGGERPTFSAELHSIDGTLVAKGKDFGPTGQVSTKDPVKVLGEDEARALAEGLAGQPFRVVSVVEKPFRRSPAPPFITSTLQQEASRKLRMSAQRAMQVAQRLYEQGWITYMRTDSTTLSEEAISAARHQAAKLYGSDYLPAKPRRYASKVKNAQEAHEAIRPAGETFSTPEEAARSLVGDELRLYELVWKRTIASQMADATGTSAQVRLIGRVAGEHRRAGGATEAEFQANGTVISFPGFLRAYVEGSDDPDGELAEREVRLPPLAEGDLVEAISMEPRSHATQAPARYTEASLVKALEELGVGRPSTYASIISTIQDRGYVWKKGNALVPSFVAFAVVGLLERYFDDLVDYGFTASMEDDLDAIAEGREEALPWLTSFYFGGPANPGLKELVASHLGEIDAREVNSIPIGTDSEGREMVVRVGRYGPYLQRGEERVSLADDLPPDELTPERAEELLSAPSGDRLLGTDPASGLPVFLRTGRFGPYVQLGEATEDGEKPRTASLFKSMSKETVTLDQALELLALPRVLGQDPASGEEVVALNGRFGPYLKRGNDTRSLASEEELLTIDLDAALALFAQPKTRRGRASQAPLRELGPDPTTGAPVVLKDGRFGPYVTDGTTNASLRKGDDPETITIERAAELLADRRAAGPSAKRGRAGSAKKAASTTKAGSTTKAPGRKAPSSRQPAGMARP